MMEMQPDVGPDRIQAFTARVACALSAISSV
jgi:hypothetical protein